MSLMLRPFLPASGLALVSLLGACGDSSGPSEAMIDDPQGLVTSMRDLVGTLTNGPLAGVENVAEFGVGALDVLSRGHGPQMVAVLQVGSLVATRPSSRPFAKWAHGLPYLGGRQFHTMSDAIDDRFYRNVYEFNPLTQQYEDNGSDLGPAHGVRFVLYDVVAGTLEPGTQVGTLDVEDLSAPQMFQVSVRVTGMAQETYANYTVTLPDNGVPISDGFDLVAEGILSRGADPMDFNLHFAQVNPRNQSVKLDLVGPVENLHFDFVDTFNPSSENSHTAIDVLLNKGKESVRLAGFQDFDGDSRLYTTDLTLRGNGQVFASATRDDGGFPVWEKASGDELTQDEQILIGTLLSGVFDSVFHSLGLMLFVLLMLA
jgi:hypothetical protein